jgi:hypothetical protein
MRKICFSLDEIKDILVIDKRNDKIIKKEIV